MNGNRDTFPVSSAEVLHRSPSACRKIAKGCSPSKLPDCTGTRFSSSRKGQISYKGRTPPKGSIMETVILAANCERSGLVGGKIVTKRSVAPPFSSVADTLEDFLPTNLDEDMKKPDECSLPVDNVDRHVTDSPWQQSSAEKVSKWLEESEHNSIITTEFADIRSLDHNEEQVMQGHPQGLEICCMPATEALSPVHADQDAKQLVEMLPINLDATQAPVEVLKDEAARFSESSLTKTLSRFFQMTMCLSVVCLGLFIQISSMSWDQCEPPPT